MIAAKSTSFRSKLRIKNARCSGFCSIGCEGGPAVAALVVLAAMPLLPPWFAAARLDILPFFS
jgi:hypothetical protein